MIRMGASNENDPSRARIVIQGVRGAFHEVAARLYFGEQTELIPALSFSELFEKASDPAVADAAIVAIENSIAGSILGNYRLLLESGLAVEGEVYLPIRQNLLALPGVTIDDLCEVHSHPMALAQCSAFFKKYPHIRLVESSDTAESAAAIAREQNRRAGAVASSLAAELYGLSVLAPSIETFPQNATRFLVVRRKSEIRPPDGADKVSITFTLQHTSGSLANVLQMLAAHGANLTKIQSVPLPERPWEYHFIVDFKAEPGRTEAIVSDLYARTLALQVLGVYRGAEAAQRNSITDASAHIL